LRKPSTCRQIKKIEADAPINQQSNTKEDPFTQTHTQAMNIFALSLDPKEAAKAHGDKHVVKMILETCQMLYTSHWTATYPQLLTNRSPAKVAAAHKLLTIPLDMVTAPKRKCADEQGFRPVHLHHPCTVWVRESIGNYMWAVDLALAIAEEYEFRWPGRTHSCKAHALWLQANLPPIPDSPRTPFALAMPDQYKLPDAVASYINFYSWSKKDRGLTTYTRREPPAFLSL